MKIRNVIVNMKVGPKFLLIFLAAMSMVLASVWLTYRMPYAAYDEQLYDSTVQVTTLFADRIQSELSDLEMVSWRVLSDNVLQKNLSIMKRTPYGSAAWIKARSEVEDRVVNFSLWVSSRVSLQLKNTQGVLFSQFFRTAFSPLILTTERMSRADVSGTAVWCVEEDVETNRLYLVRNIRQIEDMTLDNLATMLIEADLQGMVDANLNAMARMNSPMSCAIYNDGICLYASDEAVGTLPHDQDGYKAVDHDHISVCYTAENGWKYVTLVDYTNINHTIGRAMISSLLIDVLVAVAAILLGAWLVHSLLRHLQLLLQKFDTFAVSGQVWDVQKSPYLNRGDEIGKLHRHFDRMTNEYHQMMERNQEQQRNLQEKQIQQLRAQVRPHFLNNTLESIYCLAKQEGNERIAVMTHALGKMLRASLNDKRDMVTVREDLDITREYLKIQQIRYGERMNVDIQIDDGLLTTMIPAMTIQPLVENAVHHALEQMTDTCRITITGSRNDAGRYITVQDNGPGMDENILSKLEKHEVEPEGMGIGMRNIHKRLQYAFGDDYGLKVCSREGLTQVIICMPGKMGEK